MHFIRSCEIQLITESTYKSPGSKNWEAAWKHKSKNYVLSITFVLSPPTLVAARTHSETQYRKFETNTPRKGIVQPQSQFPHSCVCERFIYSHDRSRQTDAAAGIYVDWSWKYVNRSQTHECGNWDWGRAIPRKGIHK